jgi:hypothetical protein
MWRIRSSSPDQPHLPCFEDSELLRAAADEPQHLVRRSLQRVGDHEQRSVDQAAQHRPKVVTEGGRPRPDRRRVRTKEGRRKSGQPDKALALGVAQAVHASPQRAPQRVPPRRLVAARRVEIAQSAGNSGLQRIESVSRHAGCGQLDCQWQAVEATADGRDGIQVLSRQAEIRAHLHRAAGEEPNRRRLARQSGVAGCVDSEREDRPDGLIGQPESLTGRHQRRDLPARPNEVIDSSCARRDKMLDIVQHQQKASVADQGCWIIVSSTSGQARHFQGRLARVGIWQNPLAFRLRKR